MKRRFLTLLLAALLVLVLVAFASCTKPHDLVSIEAVNVPEASVLADAIDDSGILLRLHYADEQDEEIPFKTEMLPESLQKELQKTGSHDVSVLYLGMETTFTLRTTAVYTVSFRNALGDEIKSLRVTDGSAAAAPADDDMIVEGYRFLGTYDKPFGVITADTVVTGEYVKTWNVTFYDGNGDVLSSATVDEGTAAPAPENTAMDGYVFTYWDTKFDAVTADTDVHGLYIKIEPHREIKNIIFMIPDGAGFGTYDLANALKQKYGTGVFGQATPITTDAIEGMTVTGLYLDEFLIATADTKLASNRLHDATDSAAAGTALLTGEKTNYLMVGVEPHLTPVANLLELCRLEGKSTGFVTTKCLVDATPSTALAHSLKRADQDDCAYQMSVSKQILMSGADIVLCYGSDGGYYAKGKTQGAPLHGLRATDFGYTVVNDLASLKAAVNTSKASKIFSNFQINYEALNGEGYTLTDKNYSIGSVAYNTDYQALHLLYDCDAKEGTDLTLLEMTKAALTAISENADNENGFCLIIEGGAIDNAAEARYVREAVSEYLAFDEAFGYCVNWAMQRDDTIVIACPDHDSGGFYLPTEENCGMTLDAVLDGLHDGTIERNTQLPGKIQDGHSPQNVPVWLYAPGYTKIEILEALGLPLDANADTVRTGRFFDGSKFNEDYVILNSDISPAIVSVADLMSFEDATKTLFASANDYGKYNTETGIFTFKNGETVEDCSTVWKDKKGNEHEFPYGCAFFLTNPVSYLYEGDEREGTSGTKAYTPFKAAKTFYMPEAVLREMGYIQ